MFKKFALCACLGVGIFDMGSAMSDGGELCFKGEQGKIAFEETSSEQLESAMSITFKNMTIDGDFKEHFAISIPQYVPELSFENCKLGGALMFCDILTGRSVQNLSIINCRLSAFDARIVLNSIDHYALYSVDFSGNGGLGNDSSLKELGDYFKNFWGISILY